MRLIEFFMFDDRLPGGRGDRLSPRDVRRKELEMGIAHEMEHTNDRRIASEIARDHIAEDPHYYSDLKAAGRLLGSEEG